MAKDDCNKKSAKANVDNENDPLISKIFIPTSPEHDILLNEYFCYKVGKLRKNKFFLEGGEKILKRENI